MPPPAHSCHCHLWLPDFRTSALVIAHCCYQQRHRYVCVCVWVCVCVCVLRGVCVCGVCVCVCVCVCMCVCVCVRVCVCVCVCLSVCQPTCSTPTPYLRHSHTCGWCCIHFYYHFPFL